jgi:hypothetical protein
MRRSRQTAIEEHPYKTYMMWGVMTLAFLAGLGFVAFSYFLIVGLLGGASLRSLPPMLLFWTFWLVLFVVLVWESTRNYRLERRWARAR